MLSIIQSSPQFLSQKSSNTRNRSFLGGRNASIQKEKNKYARRATTNIISKKTSNFFLKIIYFITRKKINEQEWLEPFVHFKSPILVFTFHEKDNIIFVNSNLIRYEFQKVIDPYTAWQELNMFLGGVIPRQIPETVDIKDKDRIAGHGFDKWSFRKHKEQNNASISTVS